MISVWESAHEKMRRPVDSEGHVIAPSSGTFVTDCRVREKIALC